MENTQKKYITSVSTKGKETIFNMNYTYTAEEIKKSTLMTQCFDNYVFLDDGDFYYLEVNGKYNCTYSDTTKITIETPNIVSKSNAQSIKGKKYTWIINDENKDDVSIFIRIYKNKIISEVPVFNSTKIIILIILAILIGIALFLLNKSKNNNK